MFCSLFLFLHMFSLLSCPVKPWGCWRCDVKACLICVESLSRLSCLNADVSLNGPGGETACYWFCMQGSAGACLDSHDELLDAFVTLSSRVSSPAQSVISEEKSQCYRVLGSGQGPSSCSLPILRNITKQICCCSRVGKAWGPNCQRCPYFGSGWLPEIRLLVGYEKVNMQSNFYLQQSRVM